MNISNYMFNSIHSELIPRPLLLQSNAVNLRGMKKKEAKKWNADDAEKTD